LIAIDVWDGIPAQVAIFTNNSGWTHPVLMLGGQAGIMPTYNCGYDYVFVIGGDGIIKWRGVPTSSALAGAVSDAISELSTSPAPEGVVALHRLLPGYPNPFNPMTNIPFELAGSEGQVDVQLDILDIRGRVVRTLVDGFRAGGQRYISTWDGTDQTGRKMPSGTYMSRLKVQGLEPQARLLTLVK
jgi:hypothetical protein